jgi:predicted dehydrogenase
MIDWLVIGIGDITTRRVIPAILEEPRSRLKAFLTRDPRKAAAYPGVQAFTTLEDALRHASVDAVYVASPVFLHGPQTIASLEAGKHVLCEKPTAMNHAEAQSMVAAARASHRLFAVSYYRRLFPKLLRARQLMAEGAIGQPLLAEANCHTWLQSKGPDWPKNWFFDPARAGGGPLYDIASHRIDALNFLFGKPRGATGILSNAVHQIAVEDAATVLIEFARGIHATVDVRWNSHIRRDQFRVIGTDGEMNLDPLNGPILRWGEAEESLPAHPTCTLRVSRTLSPPSWMKRHSPVPGKRPYGRTGSRSRSWQRIGPDATCSDSSGDQRNPPWCGGGWGFLSCRSQVCVVGELGFEPRTTGLEGLSRDFLPRAPFFLMALFSNDIHWIIGLILRSGLPRFCLAGPHKIPHSASAFREKTDRMWRARRRQETLIR